MYKLFLTLRYLKSRIISYLATLLLALGVAVLIIVTSVMGGFQREMHKKIRGSTSDVTVDSLVFYGLERPDKLLEKVEAAPHVVAAAPFIKSLVLLSTFRTRDYGFLIAIDPVREEKIGEFARYLLSPREILAIEYERFPEIRESESVKERLAALSPTKPKATEVFRTGKSGLPGILVGSQLYYHLDLKTPRIDELDGTEVPGDIITLYTSTDADVDPSAMRDDDFKKAKYEVVGVFKTGMYEQDKRWVITEIGPAQTFVGVEDRVSGLHIKLDDYRNAQAVTQDLRTKVQGWPHRLIVTPWNEVNRTLIEAVKIEQFMIYFIVFFMIVLASAALTAIMTMLVIEKTKDLGILGAVGATAGGRFVIFLWQGGLISTMGALLGSVVGLLFVWNINWIDENIVAPLNHGRRVFDPAIYYLDSIPTEVDPVMITACVVPTIVVGIALSLIPAIRAARLDPIEALRHE